MACEHMLTALGLLSFSVACGVSQYVQSFNASGIAPIDPDSGDRITTIPVIQNPPSNDTVGNRSPGVVAYSLPTQTATNRPTNKTDDGSKISPVPKINDQTAQTFANLETAISNEIELLASVHKDFKATMTEALKNLSKIDPSKLDVHPISTEMNTMSTVVGTDFDATDKRLKDTLFTEGRSLNNSIASFVKIERDYMGKMKYSPDSRTISKQLQLFENGLYRGLGSCLSTFNGSIVSDIFTLSNTFDTYFMDIDTFVSGVAGCESVNCAALSKTLLVNLVSWRTSITAAFKRIPHLGELNDCITDQINTAKHDLVMLGSTVPPPVDTTAVITNQTAMLEANAHNLFGKFTKNVQKLVNGVFDKINHLRTFVGRNVRDDPKSIIDSNLKIVATGSNVTIQLLKAVLPRISNVSQRLIAPLHTIERALQHQIETILVEDDSPSSECDAAVEIISTIKQTFNSSMIACYNGTQDSMDAILTATVGMINGTLNTFINQIALADQFYCGRSCTISAMQEFAQQLRSKLEVGATLLVELRKSVAAQINRIYTAFESCMDGSIQETLGNLNEQNNVDIKRCLAST